MELSASRLRAVTLALETVLPLAQPADMTLRNFFHAHAQLGQGDRAFIAEVVFGVLRHRRLLEHSVGGTSARQLALAELNLIEGWSLRRVESLLRGQESDWLGALRAKPIGNLAQAVQLSLPDWLFERLQTQYGEAQMLPLARGLLQSAPLDLRVNPLLISRAAVLATLAGEGIDCVPTPHSPLGVRLKSKPALQRHALFVEGKVEVQDEASQLLGFLTAPRRREMVVDFCAGAGGKTLLLGALMHSEGRLYAFDTSERRLANLRPRLKRSGLSNVHPQRIDSENDARVRRLAGKIDRVLVDAPCTGLGTLRRNPDLKWRQSPEAVVQLAAKQRSILAAAARLVKPGGRLVYATCSILQEENEAIAEEFLQRHGQFKPLSCTELLARQDIALDTGVNFKVRPDIHGMDGFFAAVFEREASSA